MYKCNQCGKVNDTNCTSDEWCADCNGFTEKMVLDLEAKTTSYGREHPVNCPNGCTALDFATVSDADFGNFSRDVVIIYCPVCDYEHDVFTK